MRVGDVLVAGQRMADQDRVRPVGVERAIGLVGDRERPEIDAAIEPQRRLDEEAVARPIGVGTLQVQRAGRSMADHGVTLGLAGSGRGVS